MEPSRPRYALRPQTRSTHGHRFKHVYCTLMKGALTRDGLSRADQEKTYEVKKRRFLRGRSLPEYAALEPQGKGLMLASNKPFVFTDQDGRPVEQPQPEPMEEVKPGGKLCLNVTRSRSLQSALRYNVIIWLHVFHQSTKPPWNSREIASYYCHTPLYVHSLSILSVSTCRVRAFLQPFLYYTFHEIDRKKPNENSVCFEKLSVAAHSVALFARNTLGDPRWARCAFLFFFLVSW